MKADLVDYLEVNPFWCFFCATPSVLGAGFLLKINATDMIIRKLIELKSTKMLIKKPFFYAIFYSAVVFIVSLFVLPYYIDGDQFYYRDFYKYCFYESLTLSQQFDCYQTTLASSEPGYFILSKLANAFLDKDLYIAIANAILTFIFSILVFKNYKAVWHRHVFLILLLTNYYLIVMFFAAERLKFSFIFLALALLISGNKKLFLFFGAMFIHIQSALLIGPYYIAQVFDKSESKWIKVLTIVGFIIVFAIALFVLKDHIESKFTSYSNKTEESGSGVLGSQVGAISAFFYALILFSEQFLGLWSIIPQDLKNLIPAQWQEYVGIFVGVAMVLARLKKQPEIHTPELSGINSLLSTPIKTNDLAWMIEAKRHIGLKEVSGKTHNSTILSWLKSLGAWWSEDETAWCGTFIAHCLKVAGVKYPKHWY
ncbi:hypothetical protein SE27_09660 [Acinetobacter harbinensis]|nr:EpsG family protein [Acinetobacter harbinensis]KWQ05489.1 hypothetical protein SE27_09660 [Acinetobacter harbinensis]